METYTVTGVTGGKTQKVSVQVGTYTTQTDIEELIAVSIPNHLARYISLTGDSTAVSLVFSLVGIGYQKINTEYIRNTASKFPGLFQERSGFFNEGVLTEIVLVWLYANYKEVLSVPKNEGKTALIEVVSMLSKLTSVFGNTDDIYKKLKTYSKELRESILSLKKNIDNSKASKEKLESTKPVTVTPFSVDSTDELFTFQAFSFLEKMFDDMVTSIEHPLVVLVTSTKRWTKMSTTFDTPKEWVLREYKDTGLYVYFKHTEQSIRYKKHLWSQYFFCRIFPDSSQLSVTVPKNIDVGEDIADILLMLGASEKTDVTKTSVSIRGTVTVMTPVNLAVFADAIVTNPLLSSKMTLLEWNSKPQLQKMRFTFTVGPALMTLLQESDVTVVRMSRVRSESDANTIAELLAKLFSVYLSIEKNIIKEYQALLPDAGKLISEYNPKVTTKKNIKTGDRLRDLETARPFVFQKGYSGRCQGGDKQPKIISKEEAKEKISGSKRSSVVSFFDPSTGVMDYYECPGKTYKHIGLITTKEDKGDPTPYSEQVPMVPCCFTDNQYSKADSLLAKREKARNISETNMENTLRETDLSASDKRRKIRVAGEKAAVDFVFSNAEADTTTAAETIGGYILTTNAKLPQGRLGELPFYLKQLVEFTGYKTIKAGKQVVFPFLRLGVGGGVDSLLWCLEKAVNQYEFDEIQENVKKTKDDLLTTDFTPGIQSLFEYSREELVEQLQNPKKKIKPELWRDMLSTVYNVNIILFQVTSEALNGDILVPYGKPVYLPRLQDKDRLTVPILCFEDGSCELIIFYNPKKVGKYKFKFLFDISESRFVKKLTDTWNDGQKLYTVNTAAKKKQIRVKSFSESQSFLTLAKLGTRQIIDSLGKCRGVKLSSGELLFFSTPTGPLDLKLTTRITEADLTQALKTVASLGGEIVSQEGDKLGIRAIWVDFSNTDSGKVYIPVVSGTKPLKKVPFAKTTDNNPMRPDKESFLKRNHIAKKIAVGLQEYTLYLYANSLSDDIFQFDPTVVYFPEEYIFSMKSSFVSPEGKLLCKLQEYIPRLKQYLEIQRYNSESAVREYKYKLFLRGSFESYLDFTRRPQEYLFLSEDSVKEFLDKAKRKPKISVVHRRLLSSEEVYAVSVPDVDNGRVCLIQGVKNGDIHRAVAVSEHWIKHSKNLGYNSDVVSNSTPNVYLNVAQLDTDPEGPPVVNISGDYYAVLRLVG